MYSFKEYVARRDEVSYNPLHKLSTGHWDAGNAAAVIGHVPVATVASIPAALSGIGAIAPQYRSMTYGNPYKSQDMAGTKHLALTGFERSRDWLLNYAVKQPKVADWLMRVLEEVEKYFQSNQKMNIAGVPMGKQASILGGALALPGAFIKGIATSLKNVIDTLNPVYDFPPDTVNISENVKKMLQALDALQSVDKELAVNKLEEFMHVLDGGGGASHIDPDARYTR